LDPEWGFNVLRMRQAADEKIYWSPVHGESAHKPEKFGKLTGLMGKKKAGDD